MKHHWDIISMHLSKRMIRKKTYQKKIKYAFEEKKINLRNDVGHLSYRLHIYQRGPTNLQRDEKKLKTNIKEFLNRRSRRRDMK